MSKTPMTWLGLIKLKLSEEKAKGKSPSIGDVTPLAKKEWVQIKEGKHPKYIQGKAQTFGRKKKGNNKSRKADKESSSSGSKGSRKGSSSNSNSNSDHNEDIHALLSKVKLCGKCKKNVEKILKNKEMTGGYNQFYDVPPMVSGAQSALPLTQATDNAPIPFEGKSSASGSSQYGAGQAGGGKSKKGRKGKKSQKGGNSGGCGGTCVMGGAGAPLPHTPANTA